MADALSRSTMPCTEENMGISIASQLISLDPQLDQIRETAKVDKNYQKLLTFLKNGCNWRALNPLDELYLLRQFINEMSIHEDDQLILYQTDRIFVPAAERPRILQLLHLSHSGITKTRQLAKQLYFWPSLSTDVKTMVQSCKSCQELLPSKPQEPFQETKAEYPLELTSSDLFELSGQNYLVYTDRYSGMIWCDRLRRTHSGNVIKRLEKWMLESGYPKAMRTDGGPQYRTEFKDWCKLKHIQHELSCPYNPQSNGHAESAVKQAKYLLKKCNANIDKFNEALFEWRNTPRADGLSPSDLFFGRRLRSASLPALLRKGGVTKTYAGALKKRQNKTEQLSFPAVPPGTPVVLQNPHTKRWDEHATIVSARRPDNRSFIVQNENGTKMRTGRQIRFNSKVDVLEYEENS